MSCSSFTTMLLYRESKMKTPRLHSATSNSPALLEEMMNRTSGPEWRIKGKLTSSGSWEWILWQQEHVISHFRSLAGGPMDIDAEAPCTVRQVSRLFRLDSDFDKAFSRCDWSDCQTGSAHHCSYAGFQNARFIITTIRQGYRVVIHPVEKTRRGNSS